MFSDSNSVNIGARVVKRSRKLVRGDVSAEL